MRTRQRGNGGRNARRWRIDALAIKLFVLLVACAPEAATAASSELGGGAKAVNYILIVILVSLSALFAGLTLGMMSLDKIGLQIIANGDDPKLANYARKISPVRADGNRLLCTLLLGNVCTNAMLSILMANLTSGLVGFFVSSGLITIFGEILPQAVCSRHALRIGAAMVPVMRVFIVLFLPVTFFLSLGLDKMLGEEIGTLHTQVELRELMQIHVKHGAIDVETGREVQGALQYRARQVHEVMTPIDKVYMLHWSARLNFKTISELFKAGFSRVPVYDQSRNDIKGLILVKDLIFIDPEDETPVKNFVEIFGRGLQVVWHDSSLGEVLGVFKQGKSHMAVVRDVNNSGPGDPFYEVKGIITLEDIIETILGDEIVDETDVFLDMNRPDLPLKRENFDMSRLRLLNGDADVLALSPQEAQAVVAHLVANVPQFQGLDAAKARNIVAASPVLNLVRTAVDEFEPPAPEDVLYRRGRPTNTAMLVLNGKVAIVAGKDEFRSEVGAWTMLAADALVEADGTYRPDFTAFIVSDRMRCIQLPASIYRNPPDRDSPKAAASLDGSSGGSRRRWQQQQQQQQQQPSDISSPSPLQENGAPAEAEAAFAFAAMPAGMIGTPTEPSRQLQPVRLSEGDDAVPLIAAVGVGVGRSKQQRRASSSAAIGGHYGDIGFISSKLELTAELQPHSLPRSLSVNSALLDGQKAEPLNGSGSSRHRGSINGDLL